jgi:WD40 repeat protein
MRTALLVLPIVLIGCSPSRQAAVSNDGRLASTAESGTSVAGRGKVAPAGGDVAWSPDGQTLAIATKDGTVLWPKGGTIPKMSGPYAWSTDGTQLAGTDEQKVSVRNLQNGETREIQLDTGGIPDGLGWTSEGWPFAWHGGVLSVEGGAKIDRKEATIYDAVPGANGEIAWLESSFGSAKNFNAARLLPLNLCRWTPSSGAISMTPVGVFGTLLTPTSPRRLSLPMTYALAPGGRSVAVGGIVVEAGTRTIDRLRILADKQMTKTEEAEAERLLAASQAKAVVVQIVPSGPSTTLWSAPIVLKGTERGIEDLAWSPNGKWLAIARRDGTVRVAAGD